MMRSRRLRNNGSRIKNELMNGWQENIIETKIRFMKSILIMKTFEECSTSPHSYIEDFRMLMSHCIQTKKN